MKKIAAVIYEGYCTFEFSIALEMFAMQEIPVVFFGEEKKPYRSEEGLLSIPEYTLDELDPNEFDALILTGFQAEKFPLADSEVMKNIIRTFDEQKKVIAAISAGPLMLIKAGIMKDRPFMCACPKDGLLEEGITMEEMKTMKDWDECIKEYDTLKYIRSDHIITSVAYGFREWAMEIGKMLDIPTYPKSFGLSD